MGGLQIVCERAVGTAGGASAVSFADGNGEGAGGAEVGEGEGDGGPSGVLSEVCAEDDFKTGAGWPPVLLAVGREERVMDYAEAAGAVL